MTVTALPPAPTSRPRRTPVGCRTVQGVGELLITLGVLMALLVVYQLFWTNLEADRKATDLEQDLRTFWASPAVSQGQQVPGGAAAIIYIERLGKSWEKPIVEGVGLDDLAKGVGHFTTSAGPGQIGNFAVAAHRATHGEPFAHLDSVRPGDKVVVETKDHWYIYTVDVMPSEPDRAWKLVNPSYGSVLLPVPEQPGAVPSKALITLVTCNPRWGSTTRLIIYGHLSKDMQKPGELPSELRYTQPTG